MKKSVFLIGCMLLCSLSFGQTKISIDSVGGYINKLVTVCAKVYGVKTLEKVTFLNIGAPYPKNLLTVAIFVKDKKNFKTSLDSYDGKEVCITGNIVLYKGKPEIIAREEKDIVLSQ